MNDPIQIVVLQFSRFFVESLIIKKLKEVRPKIILKGKLRYNNVKTFQQCYDVIFGFLIFTGY